MNRKRRRFIIAELSRMSRKGWQHARPEEYRALEAELAADRSNANPTLRRSRRMILPR